MNKKKQKTPVENKTVTPVTDEEIEALKNRFLKGDRLAVGEFDLVLRKAAQDVHTFVNEKKKSPIEYLSEKTGVSTSAINSYFFTSYGVYQKDIEAKMHPYVAFTLALVHSINIGAILGELRKKEADGHSTDSAKK